MIGQCVRLSRDVETSVKVTAAYDFCSHVISISSSVHPFFASGRIRTNILFYTEYM